MTCRDWFFDSDNTARTQVFPSRFGISILIVWTMPNINDIVVIREDCRFSLQDIRIMLPTYLEEMCFDTKNGKVDPCNVGALVKSVCVADM